MLTSLFRPQTFEEIVGQDLNIELLKSITKSPETAPRVYIFQGDFGTGKCVPEHVRLSTESGYVRIGSLEFGEKEGFHPCQVVVATPEGPLPTSHTFRERSEEVVRVVDELGVSRWGTPEHRVAVLRDGEVCLIPLGDILKGDFLALSQDVPDITRRSKVSTSVAFVLGHAIGDGHLGGKEISISGSTEKLDVLEERLGFKTHRTKDRRSGDLYSLRYRRTDPRFPSRFLPPGLAGDKEIPEVIFQSRFKVRAAFLEGYLHTDGSVDSKGTVEWTSKSEKLARGVMELLESLGCHSRITKREAAGSDYFRVVLRSWSRKKLVDLFTSSSRKTRLLREAVSRTEEDSRNERNIVPLGNAAKRLSDDLREYRRGISKRSKGDLGWKTLSNILQCRSVTTRTLERLKDLYGGLPPSLESLLGYTYVRVERVSTEGPQEVYDVSVPGPHEFHAQGMRNHNTSAARVLARALNCLEGTEPCGSCENCQQDPLCSTYCQEFDASDVGSKEAIESLKEDFFVTLVGETSWRVLILDEFHLASRQAQSSLLKVLEDLPSRLFLVLCTTNAEKIIPTLRSRSVELVFPRVSHSEMRKNLDRIVALEEIQVRPALLDLICRRSRGHVRDSVMLLDVYRCLEDKKTILPHLQSNELELVALLTGVRKGDREVVQEALGKALESPLDTLRGDLYQVIQEALRLQATGETDSPHKEEYLELVRVWGSDLVKLMSFALSDWSLNSFKDDRAVQGLFWSAFITFGKVSSGKSGGQSVGQFKKRG